MRKMVLMLVLALGFVASEATSQTKQDYEKLREWRTGAEVTIPDGGVEFGIDTAVWSLESGTIRFIEPVEGISTGFVFEGRGTMELVVPDRVELRQLRRFAEDETLDGLSVSFDRMVFRTDDPVLQVNTEGATYSEDDLLRGRQRRLLEERRLDMDAQVIAGLTREGRQYVAAEMDTEKWGWMLYQFDDLAVDEVLVSVERQGSVEYWIGLDRTDDRLANGRPSKAYRHRARVAHVDVSADLTRRGRGVSVGKTRTRPIEAEFTTTSHVLPLESGMTTLEMLLHPRAELTSVRDADGNELEFIRDDIGRHFRTIENDVWDSDVVVFLETPTTEGEVVELTFDYELEIYNFVSGNSWYPMARGSRLQPHTATLSLTAPSKYEVYSMGTKGDVRFGSNTFTSVWEVSEPTKMVTFSVGDDFKTKTIESDESVDITVFGPVTGLGRGNMVHNVSADVANSVRFFEWLFDHPLPNEDLFVTSIAAGHGQAFDGFLHMSEGTFDSESPGASELFRAHEVAHQWFGHQVGWKTYRDQWLSESFAEYSAMMFVQSTMKGGDKVFDRILSAYTNSLLGSLRGAFSKFHRPWLIGMSDKDRDRVGAIDQGWRAGTVDMPGYTMQSYYKGPLVIHMFRKMLQNQTRSDDTFIAILRDFVKSHSGGVATTEDLQRIIEKHVPGNWTWFFDQWVYGAEIPTIEYDWTAARRPDSDGKYLLEVDLAKRDVPTSFVLPIPMLVELDGNQSAVITAVLVEDSTKFEYRLPARVRKVTVNPDHAVLAKMDKK